MTKFNSDVRMASVCKTSARLWTAASALNTTAAVLSAIPTAGIGTAIYGGNAVLSAGLALNAKNQADKYDKDAANAAGKIWDNIRYQVGNNQYL